MSHPVTGYVLKTELALKDFRLNPFHRGKVLDIGCRVDACPGQAVQLPERHRIGPTDKGSDDLVDAGPNLETAGDMEQVPENDGGPEFPRRSDSLNHRAAVKRSARDRKVDSPQPHDATEVSFEALGMRVMAAGFELGEIDGSAEAHEVRDLFKLFILNVGQRFCHARVLVQHRGSRKAGEQRPGHGQKIVRVQESSRKAGDVPPAVETTCAAMSASMVSKELKRNVSSISSNMVS